MVEHGVVLVHVVSAKGIKVDKAKVDVIEFLAYPQLLEKSDPFWDILNFIADLSKTFLKLVLLYAIYLLRMDVFTIMKTVLKHSMNFVLF